MKIKTNSLEPGQPKDPSDSALYEIYRAFASDEEAAAVRTRYAEGIGWGDMKQLLFERINAEIAPARAEYERLIANPREIEDVLRHGAEKARAVSRPFLAEIRERRSASGRSRAEVLAGCTAHDRRAVRAYVSITRLRTSAPNRNKLRDTARSAPSSVRIQSHIQVHAVCRRLTSWPRLASVARQTTDGSAHDRSGRSRRQCVARAAEQVVDSVADRAPVR